MRGIFLTVWSMSSVCQDPPLKVDASFAIHGKISIVWQFVSNKKLSPFNVLMTFITAPFNFFMIQKNPAWTTQLKPPTQLHFPRGTISRELPAKFSSLTTFWIALWAASETTRLQPLEPSTQDPCLQYLFATQIHYDLSGEPIAFIGNSSNKKGKFSMIKINV